MRLYHLPVSLYSFKVRLGLALMGVGLELVEPPGGSYRSAEYRAINPAGTIPALVDGDFWLAESDAILGHVEALGLGHRITPADPRRAARAVMLSRWHDLRLEPALRRLFPHVAPATRDATVVAEADRLMAEAFALIDAAVSPDGPFVTGPTPSVADCGYAATLIWLDALRGPLGLSAAPGPRLARAAAALRIEPWLDAEFARYPALVAAWVDGKLAG
ncbi:glutathione S-transferase family protein [Prosthecomicrobium hirschii]|uniref:glutathione S-transferase family protein n=1 Tax=Prosthecodimorpha hirschii TaxID=665126 RepID=UPI00221FE4A9|nr:glutathione S-transferase family protein [Prosthecomicrobium hirschii]MCW1843717.1 glutathione S-transferase family protein [Prosthecomicrobium hirschii]